MFETPILFLIFNRPDTTHLVFNEIKKIKPKKLFIAADGPRENKAGEKEKCLEARKVIDQIDWKCEVKILFREKNLGCKIAVSSAITWFFENVEEGIILEDDCVPEQSFFMFCKELLNKYKDDKRIMMISGDNFQNGNIRGNGSYYFSKYCHIWGWASWRRAWSLYDVDMKNFSIFKQEGLINNIFPEKEQQNFWMNNFENVYYGKIDTWDFQWVYTVMSNNGLSIMPNVNLVSNIGFGEDATHTKGVSELSNMDVKIIDSIQHPSFILSNKNADDYTFYSQWHRVQDNNKMLNKSFLTKIKQIIKKLLINEM